MKDIIDLHTHTIASGHAYNTIQEMINAAVAKGIRLLGITEHAPKMPGTCHEFYFTNLHIIPREQQGIRVLFGAELNILNPAGEVDLPERITEKLDFCIASLHPPCMAPGTLQENTSAVINAMKHPHVRIIGHPDDGRFPLDYEAVVAAAKEYGVILEINNASLAPDAFRVGARENDQRMLKLCEKYQVPVLMGSDAHVTFALGVHDAAAELIAETGISPELVLNDSVEKVLEYLKKH
ncbi:MAG: phosphatase [Lachnospiraceae bacterium]|nr:phosphatase [Lachnospiraceae bacterium]